MQAGYLAIETHQDRPGLVRVIVCDTQPGTGSLTHQPRRIRYVARFNDVETALMHTHESLKRRLIDPDTRLYRASLEQAIASVESIDLRHQRTHIDPDLSEQQLQEIQTIVEAQQSRQRRRNQLFQTMGYIGIALLLFNMFVLSFH